MLGIRIALLAAVCVALVLPWQRCHSACHDRVLPMTGGHACHAGGTCHHPSCEGEHSETGPCGAEHQDSTHERFVVDSVPAPHLGAVVVAAAPAAPGPVPVAQTAPAPHGLPAPPAPRTTVLQL